MLVTVQKVRERMANPKRQGWGKVNKGQGVNGSRIEHDVVKL